MGDFNASTMVYCGKCGGMDGSGVCSVAFYDKCEVKRFPTNA
jgi:hypothetical protein